jgi:methylated-DNA-protein-cysteine methyltransferase related protein
MKQLLESEGIKVKDDIIVDFEKLYWNPNIELE